MGSLISNTTHHEQAKAIKMLRSRRIIGTKEKMQTSKPIQPIVRESQVEEEIEVEVGRILE